MRKSQPLRPLHLMLFLCVCAPLSAEPDKQPAQEGKTPLVKVDHATFYKNSQILSFGGKHTIVPKNSMLVIPDRHKAKIVSKPTGEFVLWPQFLSNNRQWLWTFEVTLDQAKGKKPVAEGKLQDLHKLNRIVVCTFKSNPISFLGKPKEDQADKESNKGK